jgi:hypothetical protein
MTNPIIGYHNLLDTGSIVPSSAQAGFPVENAINWRLDDYWKPDLDNTHSIVVDMGAAVSADYFAFYSSDFYQVFDAVIFIYADTFTPPTTQRSAPFVIPAAGVKLTTFTSVSFRYWKISFASTPAHTPKIQMMALGDRLELEQGLRPGYTPPALGSRNQLATNISEQGIFIGRSLELGPVDFSLSSTLFTPAWIRANWPAWLAHMEQKPFFVLPEPDAYPDEAVIAWTAGKIATPRYSHANFQSLDLKLKAFI